MLTFNDNKAGMGGLDKEKITKVIEENTSASYSSFSKKQQSRIDEKVAEIKNRIEKATREEKQKAENSMKNLEIKLEASRDLSRDCVCIDMDAYFAAVEMRDDPKLRTIPMAVGSSAMLSTSNYLARRFGVRAGMPGFISKKLCPELTLVPGNYPKYTKVSRQFSEIFMEYDGDVGMMSLDEAYIDLTEYVANRTEKRIFTRHRYGGDCPCWLPRVPEDEDIENLQFEDSECTKCSKNRRAYFDDVEFGVGREEVVREMRFRVEQLTGLTCSAGIAANFMLAKICSDFNKPNGQFVLENDRNVILEFLEKLPIRKVGGIGRVSEAHLQSMDIRTVGDMLLQKALFPLCFSPLAQESFLRTALGLPGRPSSSDPRRKSISVERTFSPTSDFQMLCDVHLEICQMLEEDIRKAGVIGGKTITLKLKLSSFDVLTRSLTPSDTVSSLEDIQKYSLELLEKEKGKEIRLLGVRLSQLVFEEEKKSKTITDFWNDAKQQKPLSSPEDADEIIMMDTRPCPICGADVENQLEILNRHVDECIQKMTDEESPELICISVETKKKVEKPVVFSKKRKIQEKKPAAKKVATIDSFWKKE
ncbi:CBN-POLK-1 protein [Caenorhabditis brenneri]|uniref:DNA polymerase kappa n=1 Tax=Caenorhabditis brenneri TaxID=135651 RepID=G0N3F0_CAEBE|nr:CBN-POLK-1 protein [Caenorhabditis brenneri]